MNTLADLTLKEIALSKAGAIPTLEKYGFDYCCGGNTTLKKSCEEKHLAIDKIENEILNISVAVNETPIDYRALTPVKLISHIVNVHHAYIRKQSPVISGMLQKIVIKHSAAHNEVREIAYCFEKLRSELEPHMRKEEEILFPYISKLFNAKEQGIKLSHPPFRSVKNPIQAMINEHEIAGNILQELRKWSNNFTSPPDACNTFIGSYHEIQLFEKDLHQHIHLENNILFPDAVTLEQEVVKY